MSSDINETFELELTGMAHGGSAIGRHDGRTIFVPYAIPGEKIIARIVQDKLRFATAEVVRVIKQSEWRVEPRCPHFGAGKCGGCHLQHMDYAAQLEFKRQVVVDQLARIGGFHDVIVHPTIGSPDPWAYRSHVTFHATKNGELGFIRTDNEHIIPIEECHIIRPELLDLFYAVDLEGIDTLDRVRLQVGSDSDDITLILNTVDDEEPEIESDIPASINFITKDGIPVHLIGKDHLTYTVKGHTFRVTAGGFFQVNLAQAEALVDQVLTRLDLKGHERVIDLFAGVGLFTAFMAERANHVTSVESYPPAVSDADQNLDQFDNIDLIEGDVEDVLPELEGKFDAVVLDPPRAGLEGDALDALADLRPQKIIYVSCDLATFARDAKRLVAQGYTLLDVQPVDMFPHTASIELVATLQLA